MSQTPGLPPVSTFVVRFWREWSVAGARWRGRIEHVLSGQRCDFVELEEILEFVRAFGAMADDQTSAKEVDEYGGSS